MKILASLAAASVMAAAAFVMVYSSRAPGSAVATFVLGTFLTIFIVGLVLSAAADAADRSRDRDQR